MNSMCARWAAGCARGEERRHCAGREAGRFTPPWKALGSSGRYFESKPGPALSLAMQAIVSGHGIFARPNSVRCGWSSTGGSTAKARASTALLRMELSLLFERFRRAEAIPGEMPETPESVQAMCMAPSM